MKSLSKLPCLTLLLLLPSIQILAEHNRLRELADIELIDKYFKMDPEELFNVSTDLLTGKDQGWLETPSATYLLTSEDLQHSGHNRLAEQLRMVPGLMVSQTTNNIWAISTRSFQQSTTNMQLVLQDGREIYSPIFGGVFWETADLPVEILDSIEVIRGPGATRWGTNAVNGVINIRTLEASIATENMVTLGVGNEDFGLFSFRQVGEIFGGHYYTWGKFMQDHEVQDLNDDSSPHTEMGKFGFRADLPGFGEDGWTLRAEYFEQDSINRFQGPAIISPPAGFSFREDYTGEAKSHGFSVHADWSGTISDSYEWKLHSFYSNNTRSWDANGLTYDLDTFEIDFQVGKTIGSHDLLAGLRFRNHDYFFEQGPLSPAYQDLAPLFMSPQRETSEQFRNAFLQDTIDLQNNLHLLIGAKFEDNPTGDFFIPSARLWKTINQDTTYWMAASRAYKQPAFFYRNANVNASFIQSGVNYTPLSVVANPNLDPSELIQLEAGYRRLFSKNLSLDISSFYGDFDKLILTGNHVAGFTYSNENRADTYGGEVSLNWHPTSEVQIRSSVSYSYTELKGPNTIIENFSDARWRGNLQVSYLPNLNHAFYINSYATERASNEVPGYIRTDIGSTWTPNREWEVSAFLKNAFDPSHPEFYSTFYGQQSFEIPRTFFVQVRRWF
jgi:iron complex outermembrane receptor protein